MDDDVRVHQEVWALLPWLANGSASGPQRQRAELHLRGCPECRAELAREEQLARAMTLPPAGGPQAEPGLQRLLQRLDQEDELPLPVGRTLAFGRARFGLGSVLVLGLAELLLIGALGWWWLQAGDAGSAPDAAPYRTLTQGEPARVDAPRWRVVFEPGRTVAELQALLAQQGLAIVAGPSEAGVFTLAAAAAGAGPGPGAADADHVAARLRQAPGVVFAEAVTP